VSQAAAVPGRGRAATPSGGRAAAAPCRGQAEQPQRPLLLEIQRTGDRPADPSGPPAELGYLGPCRRIGHDFQAERQGRGADVVAPLDRQPERHRVQVAIGELPVRGWPASAAGRLA
jgi:hypothetical protein